MRPAIVDGENLDVFVIPPSVRLLVFDSEIREMDLVVEVRQVVLRRPRANLLVGPIVVAVVIVALAVVLVQPLLIVALQFVVEDDPIDSRVSVLKPFGRLQVGDEDLRVMFKFAGAFEAGVEGLRRVALTASVMLEKLTALLGQHHHRAPMTGYADGLDQTLLAKMPNVRRAIVRDCVLVSPKLACGHDAERTDGRQRSRLGSAECVFAIPFVNDFSLGSARQIDVTHERVARMSIY